MADNELLSTEQVARRLAVSVRRVQALIASGRIQAHKVGRSYMVWSDDLERVMERTPGRPRWLVVADDEHGHTPASIEGAVREATVEDEMERVLDEYMRFLVSNSTSKLGNKAPCTPHDIATANIDLSARKLPLEQRDRWRRVLVRATNKRRMQRLADHLVGEYGLRAKVRQKNDIDWCIDLYHRNDESMTCSRTTIYQAAIHDW